MFSRAVAYGNMLFLSGVGAHYFGTIEEHKSGSGAPVWKVTALSGEVFACADPLVVEALAETRENKTIARIEWQMRGRRRLILAVQEVTQ